MAKTVKQPETKFTKITNILYSSLSFLWPALIILYPTRVITGAYADPETRTTIYNTINTIASILIIPTLIISTFYIIHAIYYFFFRKRPAKQAPQGSHPITQENTDPYSHIPDGKETDTDESLFQ